MEIRKSHHIDSSEPDENGLYEYRYEYDLYEFSEPGLCYVVRSYNDTPQEAHFLRKEIKGLSETLTENDLKNHLFQSAVQELKKEGKKEIRFLSSKSGDYAHIENST